MNGKVVLTDHPWPATDIEAARCAAAGYELVVAPDGVTEAQLVELVADADAILTCWAKVTRAVIEAAPQLKVITRLGVGVDNIDLAAAGDAGAVVTRVPDYCVDEVSSHVVAFVHAWARGIAFFDKEVHEGRWMPSAAPLRRVKDLTIGIWGYGLLGVDTAAKFAGLGCTVLADDRHPERVAPPVTAVPIDELLERSDVVSLHLPLNDDTRGLVDAGALGLMADGALLVNCARGGVVDHDAL
ncbi:MAG TPA: NAD(P)-dependent oxidoreductase, partial [Acidimicrobiales bacterium]